MKNLAGCLRAPIMSSRVVSLLVIAVCLSWAAVPLKDMRGRWQCVILEESPIHDLGIMTLEERGRDHLHGEVTNIEGTVRHSFEVDREGTISMQRIVVKDHCSTTIPGHLDFLDGRLRWQLFENDGACGFARGHRETRLFVH